jgi:hypothetical protein
MMLVSSVAALPHSTWVSTSSRRVSGRNSGVSPGSTTMDDYDDEY